MTTIAKKEFPTGPVSRVISLRGSYYPHFSDSHEEVNLSIALGQEEIEKYTMALVHGKVCFITLLPLKRGKEIKVLYPSGPFSPQSLNSGSINMINEGYFYSDLLKISQKIKSGLGKKLKDLAVSKGNGEISRSVYKFFNKIKDLSSMLKDLGKNPQNKTTIEFPVDQAINEVTKRTRGGSNLVLVPLLHSKLRRSTLSYLEDYLSSIPEALSSSVYARTPVTFYEEYFYHNYRVGIRVHFNDYSPYLEKRSGFEVVVFSFAYKDADEENLVLMSFPVIFVRGVPDNLSISLDDLTSEDGIEVFGPGKHFRTGVFIDSEMEMPEDQRDRRVFEEMTGIRFLDEFPIVKGFRATNKDGKVEVGLTPFSKPEEFKRDQERLEHLYEEDPFSFKSAIINGDYLPPSFIEMRRVNEILSKNNEWREMPESSLLEANIFFSMFPQEVCAPKGSGLRETLTTDSPSPEVVLSSFGLPEDYPEFAYRIISNSRFYADYPSKGFLEKVKISIRRGPEEEKSTMIKLLKEDMLLVRALRRVFVRFLSEHGGEASPDIMVVNRSLEISLVFGSEGWIAKYG